MNGKRLLSALLLLVLGLAVVWSLGSQPSLAVIGPEPPPNNPSLSLTPGGLEVYPSNARASFRGRLATGNQAGSSLVRIQTQADPNQFVYSTSSQYLTAGDRVRVGGQIYTVGLAAASADTIALTTPLAPGDAALNTPVIATQSGELKIIMTKPAAGIVNGSFQILVPAATESGNLLVAQDGLPDSGNFDFTSNAQIICPPVSADYLSWTPNASSSAQTPATVINGQAFHVFSCTYEGTSSEDPLEFKVEGLINPAPLAYEPDQAATLERTHGSFDQVPILVHQLDNLTLIKMATNFASFAPVIQVSAEVLPYLSFTIEGYSQGAATCHGATNLRADVASTGVSVPFGAISPSNFTDTAQKLTVKTNASYGYVLTVLANDQLGLNGNDCSLGANAYRCIAPYGNNSTPSAWTTSDGAGFGYTLSLRSGDTYLNNNQPNVALAFTSDDGWRSLPDERRGNTSEQLANNVRSTAADEIDICYRIRGDSAYATGEYYNFITYTVTATF